MFHCCNYVNGPAMDVDYNTADLDALLAILRIILLALDYADFAGLNANVYWENGRMKAPCRGNY